MHAPHAKRWKGNPPAPLRSRAARSTVPHAHQPSASGWHTARLQRRMFAAISLLHAAMHCNETLPRHHAVGIHQRPEAPSTRYVAHRRTRSGACEAFECDWLGRRARAWEQWVGRAARGKRSHLLARGLSSARLVAATVSISHCLTPRHDPLARQPRTVRRREGSRRSAAVQAVAGRPIQRVRLKWWLGPVTVPAAAAWVSSALRQGCSAPLNPPTPFLPTRLAHALYRATCAHAAGGGAQSALYGPS